MKTFEQIPSSILASFQEIFPNEIIDMESDFFDLGGDSRTLIKLAASIEKKVGLEISPTDILYDSNVQDLVEKVLKKSNHLDR